METGLNLRVILLAIDDSTVLQDMLSACGCTVLVHTFSEWLSGSLPLKEASLVLADLTGEHSREEWLRIRKNLVSSPVPVVLVVNAELPIELPRGNEYSPVGLFPFGASAQVLESTLHLTHELYMSRQENRHSFDRIRLARDVIENIPVVFFRFSFNKGDRFRTDYISDHNTAITGITPNEQTVNQGAFLKTILPQDLTKFEKAMKTVCTEITPVQIQLRAIVHGEKRTLMLRMIPKKIEDENSEFKYRCYGTTEECTSASVDIERRDQILEFMNSFRSDLESFQDLLSEPAEHNDQKQEPLSAREQEVCNLLKTGMANAEIGKQLFISESTLKKHVYAIYKKMGVTSRAEFMARF